MGIDKQICLIDRNIRIYNDSCISGLPVLFPGSGLSRFLRPEIPSPDGTCRKEEEKGKG